MHVRPLTRCGNDGHPLSRLPEVEEQIALALTFDAQEVGRRAAITDRGSPEYLKEEALTYLLREAHRAKDADLCQSLADSLLRRCVPQAQRHLRALGEQEFESAYADLVSQIFGLILNLANDRADFLQVRFGLGLQRLAIDIFRRYKDRINRDKAKRVPLSAVVGYDEAADELDGDEGPAFTLPSAMRTPMGEESQWLLINEALALLTDDQRTAFVLFHFYEWPIESKDPKTPTISKHFGRSSKTIYLWLKAADKALESWRGQEP